MASPNFKFAHADGAGGDRAQPPVHEKVVAARLSSETVDELMFSSDNIAEEGYWRSITHLVFQALVINSNCVCTQYHSAGVLNEPKTFLPLVNKIAQKRKMKVVWSLQSYANDTIMQRLLYDPANVQKVWKSLLALVRKNDIQLLEIDLVTVSRMMHLVCFRELSALGCLLWVNVPNDFDSQLTRKDAEEWLQDFAPYYCNKLVIRSNGYMKIDTLTTSTRHFKTTMVYPESALTHFDDIFQAFKTFLPPGVMLMDIDTSGVVYQAESKIDFKSRAPRAAAHCTPVELSDIAYRKRYANEDYVEHYNSGGGYAMLEFPKTREWISYDNDQMRLRKLNYVLANDLGGVVVGEMQNDITVLSQYSLLRQSADLLGKVTIRRAGADNAPSHV